MNASRGVVIFYVLINNNNFKERLSKRFRTLKTHASFWKSQRSTRRVNNSMRNDSIYLSAMSKPGHGRSRKSSTTTVVTQLPSIRNPLGNISQATRPRLAKSISEVDIGWRKASNTSSRSGASSDSEQGGRYNEAYINEANGQLGVRKTSLIASKLYSVNEEENETSFVDELEETNKLNETNALDETNELDETNSTIA